MRTSTRMLVGLIAILTGLALPLGLLTAPATAAKPTAADERRLNRLHCDAGRADGRITEHTRAAIVRFKTRHGLPADGALGSKARAKLRSGTAKRCDIRPVPRRSGTGRRIVISQYQNWIWLVRANGSRAAQGPMIDNTRVLDKGNYRTGSYCGRRARISRNQDLHYRYWLKDFVRFAPCGIGFHEIPRWKRSGKLLHATWRLGTNQRSSDGCIRLSPRLSDRVWDFTVRRTAVRVR